MRFGMPTLVECKDIFDCVRLAARLKLSFVEINMSFPQYQAHNLNADDLVILSNESGVGYTIHADEQLNPFDFNPSVSSCYFGVMKDTIEFAKRIGAGVINMHLLKGVYVTLPGEVILLSDVYREEYMTRIREFIEMCEREIGDSGIIIAIENVDSNPFTSSQIGALELFMESPVFGMTYDVGHDECLAHKDLPVLNKYRDRISHMHLHDSNGKSAHLPLGTALVDVGEKLDFLGAGKTCLVEVKTIRGLIDSVEYLKANNYYHFGG